MYQLLYVSSWSFCGDFEEEVRKILEKSRLYNPEHQITGVLLSSGGLFLQLLEGERDVVEALYEKISGDPRHMNLITMLAQDCNERLFSEWSMAYQTLDSIDVKLVNKILAWNRKLSRGRAIDGAKILEMIKEFKIEFDSCKVA